MLVQWIDALPDEAKVNQPVYYFPSLGRCHCYSPQWENTTTHLSIPPSANIFHPKNVLVSTGISLPAKQHVHLFRGQSASQAFRIFLVWCLPIKNDALQISYCTSSRRQRRWHQYEILALCREHLPKLNVRTSLLALGWSSYSFFHWPSLPMQLSCFFLGALPSVKGFANQ